MKNPDNPNKENSIDMETINLLDINHNPGELSPDCMQVLREKVMSRIDAAKDVQAMEKTCAPFITVRESEDNWIDVTDKIKKKSLYINKETGVESFLLKVEPGACDEPHTHEFDELCYVIEGDVSFGKNIQLKTGDFHYASKGSFHEFAASVHGALLLIQTGIGGNTVAI